MVNVCTLQETWRHAYSDVGGARAIYSPVGGGGSCNIGLGNGALSVRTIFLATLCFHKRKPRGQLPEILQTPAPKETLSLSPSLSLPHA